MTKARIFLIILALIGTALIVYSPHYDYRFPCHIDEWHHISEALRLEKGEFHGGVSGFRVGFQLLLFSLSKFTDLVLSYKYFPAAWSVVSALVLFWTVYNKTGKRYHTALFAVLFFASIKSNVNITGLWFLSPLTFSIPFIYLYVFFFTEGVERHSKKLMISSLVIMLLLVPVHSISFLFSIPFLLIYSLCNLNYFRKEWRFFSVFFVMPVVGAVFYKFMTKTPWGSLLGTLFKVLQFKRGWGVLELDNSFYELYSFAGYALAALGIILILIGYEKTKKYLAYALWPITVFISIMVFRKTDVSYISPYQRNLYYFAISLPFLSALGLDNVIRFFSDRTKKTRMAEDLKRLLGKGSIVILFILVGFFTFKDYWHIPKQIDLYQVVKEDEYKALLFLKELPPDVVIATPRISTGLYSISGHQPVATYFFYGNRPDCERFFRAKECEKKDEILKKYNVRYVLSLRRIDCGWKLIYDRRPFIYDVR